MSRPTTWQEWTPEQRGVFLEVYFRALQHGDDAVLEDMVAQQVDNIPAIVSELLGTAELVHRYSPSREVGWGQTPNRTFAPDELEQIAKSMATLYARQTGDTSLQERVTGYHLKVKAIKLEAEGVEVLYDDSELALTKLFEALEIFRAIDTPFDEATTLLNIGAAYNALEEYDEALTVYEEALTIATQENTYTDDGVLTVATQENAYEIAADILFNMAFLYHTQGQLDQANEAAQRAIEMAEASGDENKVQDIRGGLALFLKTTADDLWAEGHEAILDDNSQLALGKLFEALEMYRIIEDSLGEAVTLMNLGYAYALLAEFDRTLDYLEQALAIAIQDGNDGLAADVLCDMATFQHILNQDDQAYECFSRALEIAEEAGDYERLQSIQEQMESFLEK